MCFVLESHCWLCQIPRCYTIIKKNLLKRYIVAGTSYLATSRACSLHCLFLLAIC